MSGFRKYARVAGTQVRAIVSLPASGLKAGDVFTVVRTRRSKHGYHVTVRLPDGHYDEFQRSYFEPVKE